MGQPFLVFLGKAKALPYTYLIFSVDYSLNTFLLKMIGCESMKKYQWLLMPWISFIFCIAFSSFVYAQGDLSVIIKQIQSSVVVVLAYDTNGQLLNQGNGFFINNDGDVITNIHILQGAASAEVKTAYGKIYTITGVLAQDKEGGLIRVSVDIPPRLVRPLMLSTSLPKPDERIIVVGSPTSVDQKVSDGIISDIYEIPIFGMVVRIAAPMPLEFSCNPLVNMQGEIIGLAFSQSMKDQNQNIAIHNKRVTKLLEDRSDSLTKWVEGETNEWFSSGEGLCNKGVFYLAAEDYENALFCFEKAGKENPRYSLAYFYIGYCMDKLGRYSEAIEAYKRAIRINSAFLEAHYNLGEDYDRLGCYGEAIEVYKQIIRIQPKNARIHYKLGEDYCILEHYPEAIHAFKKAIDSKPDFVEAYSSLGLAYFNLGYYSEAIEAYQQAININPHDTKAHTMLGSAYSKQGCYTEAIDVFKKVIYSKPDDIHAHFLLGMAYEKLGSYTEAIDAYKQAISIKPDDTGMYYNLGTTYEKLERYREAIDTYKQAIYLKPDDARAYRMLGMVYSKLKRYVDAIDVYKLAINMRPDDADIYYRLALMYNILNRYGEEIEAYKQAILIKPDFVEAYLGLGKRYLSQGDRDSALEVYKILRDLNKDSASELFDLIFRP